MPPKVKVTREEIVEAALALVRESGAEALGARTIAARLHCSTQPVFSNFANMEELHHAVTEAAYERYFGYLEAEMARGVYPPYKAFGMAYIRFAGEERELFRLLFFRDRKEEGVPPRADWTASIELIMQANGFSQEMAERLHMELWVAVHGIATLTATSFLSLDEEQISRMLTDIYQGVRQKLKEEASA